MKKLILVIFVVLIVIGCNDPYQKVIPCEYREEYVSKIDTINLFQEQSEDTIFWFSENDLMKMRNIRNISVNFDLLFQDYRETEIINDSIRVRTFYSYKKQLTKGFKLITHSGIKRDKIPVFTIKDNGTYTEIDSLKCIRYDEGMARQEEIIRKRKKEKELQQIEMRKARKLQRGRCYKLFKKHN